MSLISPANFLAYTDHLAAWWLHVKANLGSRLDTPPIAPSGRNLLVNMQNDTLTLNDYDQEFDLLAGVNDLVVKANVESLFTTSRQPVLALQEHCRKRGSSVDASIIDVPSYLSYYNTTLFSNMINPVWLDIWATLTGVAPLPVAGIMPPAISPLADATAYPNGYGKRAVGGSLVAGVALNTALYSASRLVAVVTADFTSGSAPPTVTVTGTDNTGSTSQTWTGTLTGNNPVSALSGTGTIVGSVTSQTRATVTVTSTAGIAVGSILTINSGLSDQEVVYVEAVPSGTTFTACFQKTHTAGATVTGSTSLLLTPTTSGRRCVAVSAITIGITGHATGSLRIDGVMERAAV